MRTISYRLEDLRSAVISIGFVGENEHTQVRVDCKSVFDEYPEALASMVVLPPEGVPYPKMVTRDGSMVVWNISDSDLAAEGDGEIQLTFTESNVVVKSCVGRLRVSRSIVSGGPAPDPIDDWLNEANEVLEEAETAVRRAEDAAGAIEDMTVEASGLAAGSDPTVQISEESGHKHIAFGIPQGAKGDPGDPGDPTTLIDDTSSAANKVWSASKSGELLSAIDGIEEELDGQETISTKTVNPDSEWSQGGAQAEVGYQISFSSSQWYRYAYFDIDENDISFTVTTHQGTSNSYPHFVHFVSNTGVVLSVAGTVASSEGDFTYSNLAIPSGAVKMYVTDYGTRPSEQVTVTKKYYSERVKGITEKVGDLETDVSGLKANVGELKTAIKTVPNKNIVNGGLTGEVGSSLSTTSTSYYNNVTVAVDNSARKYIIRTKQSTSSGYPHYFWFLDESGKILIAGGEVKDSSGFYTYTVDNVPANAKSLAVLSNGTADNIIINKEIIISIESELEDIEHYFEKRGISTSPYADQLKDAGRVTALGHNFDHKYLNFAFITDTHFGGTRYPEYDARNNMKAFTDMANERWLDFAAHGGDIITDYGLTRDEALTWMDDTLGIFGDIQIPLLIAKGNHESNNAYYEPVTDTSNLDWEHTTYYVRSDISFASVTENTWNHVDQLYVADATPERIPDIQFTMLAQLGFAGEVVRNSSDFLGGYFYKDFDYNKIRVIVLDEYQVQGTTVIGISAEQYAWLGGTALMLGDKTDYSVMIISHSQQVTNNTKNLINAFQNGTSVTINGTTYDYSSQGAKDFIMYLHGHEHVDSLVTTDGFNNIGVICGYVPSESVETEDEIRFSIFTIDTTEKKIHETRIGAGSNREFDY